MSTIERYVIVGLDDLEEDNIYDELSDAKHEASHRSEPCAIIARIYEYSDSELVWTSTGDDIWPPEGGRVMSTYQDSPTIPVCLKVSPTHACCGRPLETVHFLAYADNGRELATCVDCRKVIDRKGMFNIHIGGVK